MTTNPGSDEEEEGFTLLEGCETPPPSEITLFVSESRHDRAHGGAQTGVQTGVQMGVRAGGQNMLGEPTAVRILSDYRGTEDEKKMRTRLKQLEEERDELRQRLAALEEVVLKGEDASRSSFLSRIEDRLTEMDRRMMLQERTRNGLIRRNIPCAFCPDHTAQGLWNESDVEDDAEGSTTPSVLFAAPAGKIVHARSEGWGGVTMEKTFANHDDPSDAHPAGGAPRNSIFGRGGPTRFDPRYPFSLFSGSPAPPPGAFVPRFEASHGNPPSGAAGLFGHCSEEKR